MNSPVDLLCKRRARYPAPLQSNKAEALNIQKPAHESIIPRLHPDPFARGVAQERQHEIRDLMRKGGFLPAQQVPELPVATVVSRKTCDEPEAR